MEDVHVKKANHVSSDLTHYYALAPRHSFDHPQGTSEGVSVCAEQCASEMPKMFSELGRGKIPPFPPGK